MPKYRIKGSTNKLNQTFYTPQRRYLGCVWLRVGLEYSTLSAAKDRIEALIMQKKYNTVVSEQYIDYP